MADFPPAEAPLTLDELEAYAVADHTAVGASAPAPPAGEPAPAAAVDAPLSPEELAAYEAAPPEAAAAPTPTEVAPRRVNMVGEAKGDGGDELVDVAPEDVERAYGLGYRLDPSEVAGLETVALREPEGVRIYEGGSPELAEKLAAGARIARPDEVTAEYGDAGSTTAAALEGIAQGATLGLYGLAADKLAGGAYRAERQAREAASPIVSTGANIVGAVAPALLTGGGSAGASGAGLAARAAALSPAARLAGLGGRMAEALAVRATEAGLGAGGRIAAGALAAGAEGAVDNAVRVVADDLGAGDVDITSERMQEALWDGAKWSAILGAGAGVVGEGVGRLRARRAAAGAEVGPLPDEALPAMGAADEVAPPPTVRAADEVSADLDMARKQIADAQTSGDNALGQEAEDRIAALIREQDEAGVVREGLTSDADIEATLRSAPETPEARGILDKLDQNLNAAKNARELEFKFQDSADDIAVKMERGLDEWSKFRTNFLDVYTNRSRKPQVVRKMLAQEGVQWSPEHAGQILSRVEKMESALDEMGDIKRHAIYSKAQLRDFKAGKDSLAKLKTHLTNLSGAGPIAPDARVMRGALDDVAETFTGLDLFKTHLGSFAAQMGGRPATTSEAAFQRLYMLLRADLQDPRLFGKSLADFQTATNAAITRGITKAGPFNAGFSRSGVSERGGQFGFGDVMEFDAKKIGAWLDGMADPRNHKMDRDFFAGLTSQVELAETLAKYYPVPPEGLEQIAKMRKTLEDMKGLAGANKQLAQRTAAAKRLASQTSNMQTILNGIRALPGAGSLAGTATGLAASLVALGKGAAKQERSVERAARETVSNVVTPKPKTLPPAPKSAAAKAAPPHLQGLGITANALRRAIEDAQALQDPGSDQSRAFGVQLADVAAESPELAAALRDKAMASAAFIAEKVGPPVDTSDPFQARPSLVDPVTERSVARYVDAARYPAKAFARLAQGQGTKEDKETLQALYPRQYQRYVEGVVAAAKKLKKPPTPSQRQQLHQATGVPMSREQEPEYVARRQAAYAAEKAEQGQPDPSESPSGAPLVKPSKANTEFHADRRFASRSDEIVNGQD